jgi:ATP-dependent protease HslVU (ClpYQ) peptidase subunit
LVASGQGGVRDLEPEIVLVGSGSTVKLVSGRLRDEQSQSKPTTRWACLIGSGRKYLADAVGGVRYTSGHTARTIKLRNLRISPGRGN